MSASLFTESKLGDQLEEYKAASSPSTPIRSMMELVDGVVASVQCMLSWKSQGNNVNLAGCGIGAVWARGCAIDTNLLCKVDITLQP